MKYYRQYKNFLQERILLIKEIQESLETRREELSQQKQTKFQLQQLELEQREKLRGNSEKKKQLT